MKPETEIQRHNLPDELAKEQQNENLISSVKAE
jgi:hypothetical protein